MLQKLEQAPTCGSNEEEEKKMRKASSETWVYYLMVSLMLLSVASVK
jgi:hypothetical protein